VLQGTALKPPGSEWTYGLSKPLKIGQRFLLVFYTLDNVSGEPLTIRSVEPSTVTNIPDVLDVEKVLIVPRRGGGRSLPMARYNTLPPARFIDGRCRVATTFPAKGYVLEPSEEAESNKALIATLIRATGPGRGKFDGQRILYEQAGRLYEQEFPLVVKATVKRNGVRLKAEGNEKRCLDETKHL
jgi:hypothetical protein